MRVPVFIKLSYGAMRIAPSIIFATRLAEGIKDFERKKWD
jgi:hypothetical protein